MHSFAVILSLVVAALAAVTRPYLSSATTLRLILPQSALMVPGASAATRTDTDFHGNLETSTSAAFTAAQSLTACAQMTV